MATDPYQDDDDAHGEGPPDPTPEPTGGEGRRKPRAKDENAERADPGVEAVLEVIRRLESDLEQLRRELAWSQRLATLGSLAAVVAHEVNNTLTPVTSYAQLALASPGDEALTRKALEMAVDGVERASRIAASVLGMVQDAPGGGADACCLLRDTVDDALACLARDPARDGIAVTVDLPDVAVSMTRGDLQQVLVNLLLNARKALLQTGGARRLSLTGRVVSPHETKQIDITSSASSFVELVVADNGPGIPERVRGRLFEAFATSPIGEVSRPDAESLSTDASASPKENGTGLGLSICHDLVTRVGGAISADPATERGAVFRLRLPVAA